MLLYQRFFCYNNLMIRTANKQFRRNRGLGENLPDALRGFLTAGGAKLIVRSNLTPEITIDLAQLTRPGIPSATAVQGQNAALMRLVKPEVIVTGLGVEKSFAPHGRPTAGMFTVVIVGAGVAAAIGGLIAWRICRG